MLLLSASLGSAFWGWGLRLIGLHLKEGTPLPLRPPPARLWSVLTSPTEKQLWVVKLGWSVCCCHRASRPGMVFSPQSPPLAVLPGWNLPPIKGRHFI